MDENLRVLERLARIGDGNAASRWLRAASRLNDAAMIIESMKVISAIQYPGLQEMLEKLEEMKKAHSIGIDVSL